MNDLIITIDTDLPIANLNDYSEVKATLTIRGNKTDILNLLAFIDKHLYGY